MSTMIGLNPVVLLSLLFSAQAYTKSCCSLSESELTKLRGTNPECPNNLFFSLNEKCVSCPTGTCRTKFDCVCPGNFLSTVPDQLKCEDSFGKAWPATVGEEDPDFKECTQPENKPDETNVSCCSMTQEELTKLRGWHPDCPGGLSSTLDETCSVCPVGLCRLDNSCICPDWFLESGLGDKKSYCKDSFGVSWPESVGREDVDKRSCKLNATTSSTDSSKDPTKDRDGGGGQGGSGGSSSTGDAGLSTLEIVGIVAGIVGTIVAVITLVVGLRRRTDKLSSSISTDFFFLQRRNLTKKKKSVEIDEEGLSERIQ